jgi:hypothetical protein
MNEKEFVQRLSLMRKNKGRKINIEKLKNELLYVGTS